MEIDFSKPMTVPIISGERKVVKLRRGPTDQELCDKARRTPVTRSFLGRGKSQTDDHDGMLDRLNAELVAKLVVVAEGEPQLTPGEATLVLTKIERSRVESVDDDGLGYRIVLKTPFGVTVHTVRRPNADEMLEHERSSTKTIDARRSQEIRGFLEPSGELYDKIRQRVEGYAGDVVPIIHKVNIVAEVLAQVAVLDEEEIIPEA